MQNLGLEIMMSCRRVGLVKVPTCLKAVSVECRQSGWLPLQIQQRKPLNIASEEISVADSELLTALVCDTSFVLHYCFCFIVVAGGSSLPVASRRVHPSVSMSRSHRERGASGDDNSSLILIFSGYGD